MLVYVDKVTARVKYITNLVLTELVGTTIKLTTNKEDFIESQQEKLSYAKSRICNEVFIPQNSDLLYEIGVIKQQNIVIDSSDANFDLFSASFFFASRYEEYLEKDFDMHGRYKHTSSLAFKKGILHLPVVNLWAKELRSRITDAYPDIELKERHFKYINSIDVDTAWRFKAQGLVRTAASLCLDLIKRRGTGTFKRRISVLRNEEKDPASNFDFILSKKEGKTAEALLFLQVGPYGRYDKNNDIRNKNFRNLICYFYRSHMIGVHPSYGSNSTVSKIRKEINRILNVVGKDHLSRSRFHYLRFSLPKSYNSLIKCHIDNDYSMGYSTHSGFRSGLCTAYKFYDLIAEKQKPLTIHPFAVMDVTLLRTVGLEGAMDEIKRMMDTVYAVNGEFISIFHNQNLCEEGEWIGWRDVYTKTLEYADELCKHQNEVCSQQ